MKKSRIVLVGMIILSGLIFTACPYSSTVPLSNATVSYDTEMLGKWILNDEYSDQPKYFIFSEIDKTKFKAEKYEYDSTDELYSVSATYVCFFTDIDGTRFANMSEEGTYYFFKIVMDGKDQFALFEVTDNIDEKFESSTEMYAFFKKYKNLSFFFNKDEEKYFKAIE